MTERTRDIEHILKATLPRPAQREMAAALERAYDRLRLADASSTEASLLAFERDPRPGWRGFTGIAVIAAAVVLAVAFAGWRTARFQRLTGPANEVVSATKSSGSEGSATQYVVQVNAFATAVEADAAVKELQSVVLPPQITERMRAVSVRVNEIVGSAGLVVPGTHVDVMVIFKPEGATDNIAKVVLSDVQVLTAGTRYDQEKARDGQPIQTSVVTLLLTPEDAEKLALATHEGSIVLTLHPIDRKPAETNGVRAYVVPVVSAGQPIYRVRVGDFATRADAQAAADKLRQIGWEPWVTTTEAKARGPIASLPRSNPNEITKPNVNGR